MNESLTWRVRRSSGGKDPHRHDSPRRALLVGTAAAGTLVELFVLCRDAAIRLLLGANRTRHRPL